MRILRIRIRFRIRIPNTVFIAGLLLLTLSLHSFHILLSPFSSLLSFSHFQLVTLILSLKIGFYFSSFPSIFVSHQSLFLPLLRLFNSNPHFPSTFLLFSALSRVPDLIFPSPGGKIDVPGLI